MNQPFADAMLVPTNPSASAGRTAYARYFVFIISWCCLRPFTARGERSYNDVHEVLRSSDIFISLRSPNGGSCRGSDPLVGSYMRVHQHKASRRTRNT